MKTVSVPVLAAAFAATLTVFGATPGRADPAGVIAACQKDLATQCPEFMTRADGIKACFAAKRDKLSPECRKQIEAAK